MTNDKANLKWHGGQVTREERQNLLGQQAITIWLTGLSAAGKSTLAFALEKALVADGRACFVLDGDNIRHGLNKNLGFSRDDRSENIRRIAEVARLMNDAGLIVVTALISPYATDRMMAKEIIGSKSFREVYISTPLTVCESRDPKGYYAKARAGALPDFTGVSSSYEYPSEPDLTIDTSEQNFDEALHKLIGLAYSTSSRS